ncbi:MAG: succinate dehydrogenase, cytochrome b556 subunit [Alphaproteobacteria bacterium]|nr:succinate dehydrogenase, cytochrome b556 subunit [Alphaproteobacteria bacterium]
MAVSRSRPLSPHLSVYKMTITMAMSIIHRVTGAALYVGTVLLAIWLSAAATSPEAFATVQALWGSILGRLVLLGYTWVLVHHALGGLRHFIWDSGAGFGPERRTFAQLTLVGSILITLALWALGYWVR